MRKKGELNEKVSAIICEWNPFHLGHQALLSQVREVSGSVVCILSGNFVQRGEPAILDKWARCQLALENGADLVIELPLPWACAGAERFAAGGVHLANALGIVNYLAFGSESVDGAAIQAAARALLSSEFSQRLAALPDRGEPFARRRETVLADMLGPEMRPLLRSPNAILGIEYEKALLRENSPITPQIFLRAGAGHDRTGKPGEPLSASELRARLRAGEKLDGLVPETTAALLSKLEKQGLCPADISRLERGILCRLREMAPDDFAALPDVSEGLEHRLYAAARKAGSLEELYALVKTKRYSHARVRRLVLHAFLGVTKELPAFPPYLRILGMSKTGEKLLREASPTLPLVSRPADFEKLGGQALELFRLEARADDLYALACPVPPPCGRDFTEKLRHA